MLCVGSPGLSEAEKARVRAESQAKGIGAALGVLGSLVQAAQEQARRTEQVAEQRAARKEELLDKQMKSLTAKPQEWKAAYNAYMAQKALDAFRAQEREGYNATAGQGKSPTAAPTPTPTSTPVPMCTVPPQPQTYIGAAPTSTPTPTPVPSFSGQDVARGVCEAADLVDPVMPDPATVGGPDVGDLIDQANAAMQTVPPSNPIIATFKFGVSTLKVFKDTASSAVNFICQQWERQGPYYELFPLDKQISNFVNRWNKMSTFEKVGWTIVTAMILATMVALILSL